MTETIVTCWVLSPTFCCLTERVSLPVFWGYHGDWVTHSARRSCTKKVERHVVQCSLLMGINGKTTRVLRRNGTWTQALSCYCKFMWNDKWICSLQSFFVTSLSQHPWKYDTNFFWKHISHQNERWTRCLVISEGRGVPGNICVFRPGSVDRCKNQSCFKKTIFCTSKCLNLNYYLEVNKTFLQFEFILPQLLVNHEPCIVLNNSAVWITIKFLSSSYHIIIEILNSQFISIPPATIVNAKQAFTPIQPVVKRADRSHLSRDSALTQAFMFQRLRGQALAVEGLCVMSTHHQPYFLVIIRIISGETLTAPLGVRLETTG